MFKTLMLALIFFGVIPEEISFITFEDLQKNELSRIHGREITLKGFLYRDIYGRTYISNDPGIKSCCVGKEFPGRVQLPVDGINEAEVKNRVGKIVKIKGLFNVEPKRKYSIKRASIVITQNETDLYVKLIALMVILFLLCLWKLKLFQYIRAFFNSKSAFSTFSKRRSKNNWPIS